MMIKSCVLSCLECDLSSYPLPEIKELLLGARSECSQFGLSFLDWPEQSFRMAGNLVDHHVVYLVLRL